jgi:hypothetical protein
MFLSAYYASEKAATDSARFTKLTLSIFLKTAAVFMFADLVRRTRG